MCESGQIVVQVVSVSMLHFLCTRSRIGVGSSRFHNFNVDSHNCTPRHGCIAYDLANATPTYLFNENRVAPALFKYYVLGDYPHFVKPFFGLVFSVCGYTSIYTYMGDAQVPSLGEKCRSNSPAPAKGLGDRAEGGRVQDLFGLERPALRPDEHVIASAAHRGGRLPPMGRAGIW